MSSAWTFSFSEHARKDMKKLDKQAAAQVLSYIKAKLDGCADARAEGKALAGKLKGCWRYRTGNYRIAAAAPALNRPITHRNTPPLPSPMAGRHQKHTPLT